MVEVSPARLTYNVVEPSDLMGAEVGGVGLLCLINCFQHGHSHDITTYISITLHLTTPDLITRLLQTE